MHAAGSTGTGASSVGVGHAPWSPLRAAGGLVETVNVVAAAPPNEAKPPLLAALGAAPAATEPKPPPPEAATDPKPPPDDATAAKPPLDPPLPQLHAAVDVPQLHPVPDATAAKPPLDPPVPHEHAGAAPMPLPSAGAARFFCSGSSAALSSSDRPRFAAVDMLLSAIVGLVALAVISRSRRRPPVRLAHVPRPRHAEG